MPDRKEINKRGYLKEDFRLFHLKDSRAQKVDYHYHAFDKLILLLGGKVTYVVEDEDKDHPGLVRLVLGEDSFGYLSPTSFSPGTCCWWDTT